MKTAIIKQKREGHWVKVECPKGIDAAGLLRGFDGTETVVEVNTGKAVVYFCGTSALMDLMHKKGMAMLCMDAARMYEAGLQHFIYDVAERFSSRSPTANEASGSNMCRPGANDQQPRLL